MLIGNPFQFSILINAVREWSDCDEINNGVMIITVDGFMFPANEVLNICLDCEVAELIDNLKRIPINKEIFNMKNKESAFVEIYHLVYFNHNDPDNDSIEEDWRYRIAPMEFFDKDLIVFAVSDGENVRILASKLKYVKKNSCHRLENITVREAYVPRDDINMMITRLKGWLRHDENGT